MSSKSTFRKFQEKIGGWGFVFIMYYASALFVWEFIVPLENFSLIWRFHHFRWRATNFDLCSALMVIERWGFFSVPHLLWREGIHLLWSSPRMHDTLTFCRAVGVFLFLRLRSVATGDRTPIYRTRNERSTATAAVFKKVEFKSK